MNINKYGSMVYDIFVHICISMGKCETCGNHKIITMCAWIYSVYKIYLNK